MKSGDAVLPDVLPEHVDGLRSKVGLTKFVFQDTVIFTFTKFLPSSLHKLQNLSISLTRKYFYRPTSI